MAQQKRIPPIAERMGAIGGINMSHVWSRLLTRCWARMPFIEDNWCINAVSLAVNSSRYLFFICSVMTSFFSRPDACSWRSGR